MDYGTSFTESSFQWRFPLAFQAIFAIFLVLQVIGLPESPRWLVQHDRHDEARQVAAAIADRETNDPDVVRTILDIQTSLEEEKKGGPFRFKELFTWGEEQNLRRLLITITVELGQQFTGSNMINYYGPVMFQTTMGMGRNLSMILGGAIQCTYLVGSAIPVLLMDRFGRRTLLMVCSVGLCLCFVMVSILLSTGSTNAAYGATAFIFIFQIFYGIGWLPVPWFYPSEISTTRTRTRMQAIASGWNWMAVFAVVKITPISFGMSKQLIKKQAPLLTTYSEHRLAHIRHFRCPQRRLHSYGVLLLPRDQGAGARGYPAAVHEERIHRWRVHLQGRKDCHARPARRADRG
jgi:MFS family permease